MNGRNPGIILKFGKGKEFFTAFQSRVPSKAFWEDCRKNRNNINKKSMPELNALMDQKDGNDR